MSKPLDTPGESFDFTYGCRVIRCARNVECVNAGQCLGLPPSATSHANVISEFDTTEGHVEIHGLNGGFTVFVGERMTQKDLNSREIVCYLSHVLESAHHRLSKAVQDRDARAREACTAEGRQGCSFARSEIAQKPGELKALAAQEWERRRESFLKFYEGAPLATQCRLAHEEGFASARSAIAPKSECICPQCGWRHGGEKVTDEEIPW